MFKKPILYSALYILAFLFASAMPAAAADSGDAQIVHLLNRITFGPAPGDIEMVLDVRDHGTPLTGSTPHHQSYAAMAARGAI